MTRQVTELGLPVLTPTEPVAAAVITVSDEVLDGRDDDRGGDVAQRLLTEAGAAITVRRVVADDPDAIDAAIRSAAAAGVRFVLTCGGTGIGPNDVTSDVVARLVSVPLPGIAEEIRRRGANHTRAALLSREVAGIWRPCGQAPILLLAAPGSRGGVRDALSVVAPILDYVVSQMDGAGHL